MDVVKALEHFELHGLIERTEVVYHARSRIYFSCHGYFQNVIVPVTIGIVALSVDSRVRLRRERIAVEAMRGCEPVTTG